MTNKPSVLIVGGDGLVGGALATRLVALGYKVLTTTRRADAVGRQRAFLDLSGDVGKWAPPDAPNMTVLCSAVTSLEACERDPVGTRLVNVDNTLRVADKLMALGSGIVFPSTNLVFSGDAADQAPDAPYSPLCEYGRQKAAVEVALLQAGGRAAVLRMTKIVFPDMPIIQGWIAALRSGCAVRPFSDLVIAPLSLDYLVEALRRIIDRSASGVFQITGDRDVSYADIAAFVAGRVGADPGLVQPTTSVQAGLALAARPEHTTLDAQRARVELGLAPADVWSTIKETFVL